MAEPIFSKTTERFFSRLPDIYRVEDEKQGWVFKTWLSGILDQLGNIEYLIDRFQYINPSEGSDVVKITSDLVDATTAEETWLDWIASLYGVVLQEELTSDEKRQRIISYSFTPGSKEAIRTVAGEVLYDEKFVGIIPHYTAEGPGTEWDVLLVTKANETLTNMLTKQEATTVPSYWKVNHYRENLFPDPTVQAPGDWTGSGTLTTGSSDPERLISGMGYGNLEGVKRYSIDLEEGIPHRVSAWVNPQSATIAMAAGLVSTPNITGSGWQRIALPYTPGGSATEIKFTVTGTGDASITGILVERGATTNIYFDNTYPNVTNLKLHHRRYNFCSNPSMETNISGWDGTHGSRVRTSLWSGPYGSFSGRFDKSSGTSMSAGIWTKFKPTYTENFMTMYLRPESDLSFLPYIKTKSPNSNTTYFDAVHIRGNTVRVIEVPISVSTNCLEVEVGVLIRKYGTDDVESPDDARFYWDQCLIENATKKNAYFEGSMTGFEWLDSPNVSMSRAVTGVKAFSVTDADFYNNTALSATSIDTGVLELELKDTKLVDAEQDYTFDITVKGGLLQRIGKLVATWNNGAEVLNTSTIDLTANTISETVESPVGATSVGMKYMFSSVGGPNAELRIGMAGIRQGTLQGWVPEPADPVQAVIDAGAKPAGIQLHHKTFITTWDIIESEIDNWNGLDQLSWDALEMLGLEL